MRAARSAFARCLLALSIASTQAGGAVAGPMNLQLDVVINGVRADMIGSFTLFDGGRIGATRRELADVGLDVGGPGAPGELIMLDDVAGVKYQYDERTQTIRFAIDNAKRRRQTFDLGETKR